MEPEVLRVAAPNQQYHHTMLTLRLIRSALRAVFLRRYAVIEALVVWAAFFALAWFLLSH